MADSLDKKINVTVNGKEVANNINAIRREMYKLTDELNKAEIGSNEYIETSKKISELQNIYDKHRKHLKMTAEELQHLSERGRENIFIAGNLSSAYLGVVSIFNKIKSVSTWLQSATAPFAAMSDTYANVSKYTGLTAKEVKSLNKELNELDTRTSVQELNRLAAEAGKLGITGVKNVRDFVEAADIINVALGEDLGEEAVKSMGKLADIFGASDKYGLKDGMLKVASAINTLGQSSTASEGYMLDFANRLAGVGKTSKLTIDQILAFGSVFDQNAQSVEKSATAFEKFIIKLNTSTASVARAVGVDVNELTEKVKTDMNGALMMVFESLSKMGGGLSDIAPLFTDLGTSGAGAAEMITTMAKNIDKITIAQQQAKQSFDDGKSAIDEFSVQNNTAAASIEKTRKAIEQTRIELGENLMPYTLKFTKASVGLIKTLTTISGILLKNPALLGSLIIIMGKLAVQHTKLATILSKRIIKEKLLLTQTKLSNIALLLRGEIHDVLTKKITVQTAAQELLNIATKKFPFTWAIAALGGIITLILRLTKKQREARKEMREMNDEMNQQSGEATYLIKKLDSLEKGTDEYNKTLERLKEIYPDIIKYIDTETGKFINQKKVIDDVTKSLQTQIVMRKKDEKMMSVETEYFDEQQKAFDKLRKKVTKRNTSNDWSKKGIYVNPDDLIKEIKNAVEEYNGQSAFDIASQIYKKFNLPETKINYSTGDGISRDQIYFKIKNAVSSLISARKSYEEEKKKVDESFKSFFPPTSTTTEGQTTGTSPDAEEIVDVEKQNQEILDAVKESNKNIDLENRNAEQKELDEQQEKFDKLLKQYDEFASKYNEAIKKSQKTRNDATLNELEKELSDNKLYWDNLIAQNIEQRNTLNQQRAELQNPQTGLILEGKLDEFEQLSELIYKLEVSYVAMTEESTTSSLSILQKYADKKSELLETELETELRLLNEKYQKEIKLKETAVAQLTAMDEEGNVDTIKKLQAEIARLQQKLKDEKDKVTNASKKTTYGDDPLKIIGNKDFFNDLIDPDKWKNNWQNMLSAISAATEYFGNNIISIFNKISQVRSNIERKQYDEFVELQDAQKDKLQERLDAGIISQEYYDAKMEALDKERKAKETELKRREFEREKRASLAQATINGATALIKTFAEYGFTPQAAIATGLLAATTAAQIAIITSQPVPYRKGGYIDEQKLILAGEEGREWVASHKLITDDKTRPIIEALDRYQKGERGAMATIPLNMPSQTTMSRAVSNMFPNFVTSGNNPVTNNYYTNDAKTLQKMEHTLNELLKYINDPRNHNVTLNRRIQREFEKNEQRLRKYASL